MVCISYVVLAFWRGGCQLVFDVPDRYALYLDDGLVGFVAFLL